MRTYAQTYRNLKLNIIDPNHCDIFIATWDVLGHAKHNHHESKEFQEPLDVQHVRNTYGSDLKALKVFSFAEIQPSLPTCFYRGMVSMFWQILQADLLRRAYEEEQKIQYDCIIRARPDHLFHTGMAITDPASIATHILVKDFREDILDDTFAIGNRAFMTHYSECFNRLEHFAKFREFFRPDPTTKEVGWPEQLLSLHLKQYPAPLKTIPIQYEIFRGGYQYT